MATAPGAPEHTDEIVEGELASYCTMSNVQSYTLSSREAKKPVYGMVVVANASGDSSGIIYGVGKVRILEKEHLPIVKGAMDNLYRLFLAAGPAKAAPDALGWDGESTPFRVKKARRLGLSPTDVELASP